MIKEHRIIDRGIEQYVFSLKDHGLNFDINITLLIDGDRCMLIDTGYPEHGDVLRETLAKRGIVVEQIIFSHYHSDHVAGAVAFPRAKILCSHNYGLNFKNCSELWDPETPYREADQLLYDGDQIKFRSFNLGVFETPGHSICGISLIINSKYLHIGDLIMNDQDNHPALPLVCKDGGIDKHLGSLDFLKKHASLVFLLPHGQVMKCQEEIFTSIRCRHDYLLSLIESYELWHDEGYREANLKGWSCSFWHKVNMKSAKQNVL